MTPVVKRAGNAFNNVVLPTPEAPIKAVTVPGFQQALEQFFHQQHRLQHRRN